MTCDPEVVSVLEPDFSLICSLAREPGSGTDMLVIPYNHPFVVSLWRGQSLVHPYPGLNVICKFSPVETAGGCFQGFYTGLGDGRMRVDTMHFPRNSLIKVQFATEDGLRSNVLYLMLTGDENSEDF